MDKETRLAKARFAAELALKKKMHKGDPGYTPVKGKDYFTPREITEMQQAVAALIRVPKDGKDAVVDYEKILRYTYAKVAEHVSKIPRPKDGKPGKDGKDAVVDIEALVQKVILALPKQKDKKLVIDRDQILQLIDERVKKIPQQPVRIGASVSSIRALTDVNLENVAQDAQGNYILGGSAASSITGLISEGSNVTITGTGTVGDPYVISASGGGGGGGDMTAAVYDPNSVEGDAFDMDNMVEGSTNKILTADERDDIADAVTHMANTSNPHSVTKSQVGLSNVDNTSDANKPVSTAQQTALDAKLNASEKGAANGVAELDATGKVPSAQLPAFVDDVIEVADYASLPGTGETGVLYVTLDTNIVYRWTGSVYVEISASLALGETSSTAYRGDRGKIAYDHTSLTNNPHSVTKAQVGLGNVDNTSDANKPVSTAQQTALDGKKNVGANETANVDAASATAAGKVELATNAETTTGTDTTRAITPANLTSQIGSRIQAYSAALVSWAAKAIPSGVVVGTTDTQTLSNKTLTSPSVSNPTVTGVLTYTQSTAAPSALGNLGATETIDWATATRFTGTLNSDVTISHSNEVPGRSITLYLSYDGSAQRTITWSDVDVWLDNSDGSAPATPSGSGEVLVVTMDYVGTTCYASATGNYAAYS